MPFLRVIRDRRGYETTYLMHWYPAEGHRQRPRILYMFRTPGAVRVGRDPLEPQVQRDLERQYPDIAFDWAVVRQNQQIIETAPEPRRRPKKEKDSNEGGAVAVPPDRAPAPAAAAPAGPDAAGAPGAAPLRPPLPSAIEGATPAEQMAFLTELYPAIRERIPRRTSDPSRQHALFALAERLNPAAWTDADQITTGLQQAAEALERLARVFARRRRRVRKRSGGTPPPVSTS